MPSWSSAIQGADFLNFASGSIQNSKFVRRATPGYSSDPGRRSPPAPRKTTHPYCFLRRNRDITKDHPRGQAAPRQQRPCSVEKTQRKLKDQSWVRLIWGWAATRRAVGTRRGQPSVFTDPIICCSILMLRTRPLILGDFGFFACTSRNLLRYK